MSCMVCSPHTLFICSVSCLNVFFFVLFYEGFYLHYSTFISISSIYYEPLWAIQLTHLFYILIKLGNMCDKNIVFVAKNPNILYRKYINGMNWLITSSSTVVSSMFISISRSSLFLVLSQVWHKPCRVSIEKCMCWLSWDLYHWVTYVTSRTMTSQPRINLWSRIKVILQSCKQRCRSDQCSVRSSYSLALANV